MSNATDTVIAIDHEGNVWKTGTVSDYNTAVEDWREHDDARLAGKRPQVKFYEVRSVEDPKVKGARFFHGTGAAPHFRDTRSPKGHKHAEDAATKAIRVLDNDSRQGLGGWFWLNDRPLTQGKRDLARIAKDRGWIVQDAKGRWHVAV